MSTSSGSRVASGFVLRLDGSPFLERIGDARLDPSRRGTVRRTHDERRRQRPQHRIEQRVLGMEVAADDVGLRAAAAVADQRQVVPGRRIEEGADRNPFGRRFATDRVTVPVGEHDDVTLARPVPVTLVQGDPARTVRHDVEEDQSLGAGVKHVGDRARRGLERKGVGELGPEEDGAFEAKLVECAFPAAGRSWCDIWLLGQARRCLGHGHPSGSHRY